MKDLTIAICDDQGVFTDILGDMLEKVLTDLHVIGWKIKKYTYPMLLVKELKEIAVLFLDIEMPEMDGIEVGKRIMEDNPDCNIIMATSRIDRVKEAFHIRAMRFLTKPFEEDEVKEAMMTILDRRTSHHQIEVYKDRVKINIKEKDIALIRAYNGYVEIYAGNEVFRKDVSIIKFEEEIDSRIFFRINRQYLINFGYIEKYDNNKVMVCGKSYNIARKKQKEFIQQYIDFDLRFRGTR